MAIAEVFVFARASLATFDLAYTEAPKLKALSRPTSGRLSHLLPTNPQRRHVARKRRRLGDTRRSRSNVTRNSWRSHRGNPRKEPTNMSILSIPSVVCDVALAVCLCPRQGWRPRCGPEMQSCRMLQLLQQYRVMSGRDEILQAMDSPSFDPAQQVILETEPNPAPQPSTEKGDRHTHRFVRESTDRRGRSPASGDFVDHGRVQQRMAGPSAGRQRAAHYDVLPANYVLRAIPLSPGHHHIQIEYAPIGFRVGTWISILSLAGFIVATALYVRRSRLQPRSVLAP